MLLVLAMLIPVIWFKAFTTELGKYLIILAMDVMGTIALLIAALISIGWSMLVIWGEMHGA